MYLVSLIDHQFAILICVNYILIVVLMLLMLSKSFNINKSKFFFSRCCIWM